VADPFQYIREWDAGRSERGWWHSFELPDGGTIEGVSPLQSLKDRIAQFPLAADLRGKRVLDIGTWDGWFAFEMERRGAEVVAIDNWDNPRFHEIHAIYKSRVDYRIIDIYDLTPERVGRFDIVLFMGVLYHLKHPLLALERVCALTRGIACVDSFVLREEMRPGCDIERRPVMEFYETDEMGGQEDNWCGPSLSCLVAMCRTAGFARAEPLGLLEYSATVACYRGWEPPSGDDPAPRLETAFHRDNYGINFSSRPDDYVTIWLATEIDPLSIDDLKPEVSGYGMRPLKVKPLEPGRWLVHFKLPPGLNPGWHETGVRIRGSGVSNTKRIAVDLPVDNYRFKIAGVTDGITWRKSELDLARGRIVVVWVKGLPEHADKANVRVLFNGAPMRIEHLESGPKVVQINAAIPDGAKDGKAQLVIEFGNRRAGPAKLRVMRSQPA
jgi:tRNA (mo5U34)-methyltransferase